MLWRLAVCALAALSLAAGEPRRYDGCRVYRVVPTSKHDVNYLNELARKHLDHIQFWREAVVANKTADIMVSPEMQTSFLTALEEKGIKSSLFIEDVQKLIDNESSYTSSSGPFHWHDYHSLEKIYAWMDSLPYSYPGVVTTIVAGGTYHHLDIVGVKISFGIKRPIVVIEGTIHAREWISGACVTWFINEILTSTDDKVRSIVDQFDFYIFPVTNPDGYKYSRTHDRLWRKTLRPHYPCYGADPNRNWDYRWSEEASSNNPCDENYAGDRPFGEVETRTFSEFLASLGRDLHVYLSFHSYAQMLMYPYGSPLDVADNADELHEMARKAVGALTSRYGTHYKFGRILDVIYAATGSSLDWVKSKLRTRYTFVWELRDTGEYGFLLPREQIIPTSEETFDSVLSILEDVWHALKLH